MSKYKVEFTLKQHTPIIHFQSEQIGATLRGTELKPKFDRFLMHRIQKDGQKKYSIKDCDALNYKMKIHVAETICEPIEYRAMSFDRETKQMKPQNRMTSIPTFFANMGDDWKKNPKKIVWSKNNQVTISFISFHTELIDLIVEHFEEFIFATNFGMRQSKGFGSFEVIKCSNEKFMKSNNFLLFQNVEYKFCVNLNDGSFKSIQAPNVLDSSNTFKKYSKLFEILNTFSKTYRSGINQGGYYFKSLMYKYAREKLNMTWDKKYLKSNFLGQNHPEIKRQKNKYNNPEILDYSEISNAYLLRDLLGLSTSQQWLKYGMSLEHNSEINKVKRYKSPITFKIIEITDNDFEIYLIIEPVKLLKKSFEIKCKKSATSKTEVTMKTPDSFDIYDFMKYCFNLDDIDNYAIKRKDESIVNHLNDNNHKIITAIYAQLKQQAKDI